jgi:hypothetical protein
MWASTTESWLRNLVQLVIAVEEMSMICPVGLVAILTDHFLLHLSCKCRDPITILLAAISLTVAIVQSSKLFCRIFADTLPRSCSQYRASCVIAHRARRVSVEDYASVPLALLYSVEV